MKRFLHSLAFLLLLLLAGASPAAAGTDYIRYVDPDSAGGDCTTPALSGPNAACTSLSAAEALGGTGGIQPPLNLVTNGDTLTIVCQSLHQNHTADAVAVTVGGWTTDAPTDLVITSDSSSKASTAWSPSKYRLSTTTTTMNIVGIALWVKDLQLEKTTTGTSVLNITAGVAPTWVSGVHARNTVVTSAASAIGINASHSGTAYIWNSIIISHSSYNNAANGALYTSNGGTTYVYSSTIIGGNYGIRNTNSTMVVKNCYCYSRSASENAISNSGGTLTDTNCAGDDTTPSGTEFDNVAFSTTNFANVTAGSEDLALVAGSVLIDVGADTSGEAAPMNFANDIFGEARPQGAAYDIGADEFAVAASGGGGNGQPYFVPGFPAIPKILGGRR